MNAICGRIIRYLHTEPDCAAVMMLPASVSASMTMTLGPTTATTSASRTLGGLPGRT